MKKIIKTEDLKLKTKNTESFAAVFEKTLKAAQVSYVESDGIGVLSLDQLNSKVNILSISILKEFNNVIDLIANQKISVLIIRSNKKDQFIAGANINEINAIKSVDDARDILMKGHALFDKIEQLPFPTIAIINGPCLGGGLELALACTYRIALISDAVKIALPEVNLGILPGLGGTQRLTRLIGLSNALSIIVTGKNINAKKALKLGVVDAICHEAFLDERLATFITQIKSKKYKTIVEQKRKNYSKLMKFLESNPIGRIIIHNMVKKQILATTKGKYPAPLEALHVSCKGYPKSFKKGIQIELDGFCRLVMLDTTKNLIHLFLMQEYVKNINNSLVQSKDQPITHAGIIGAGLMGAGIASVLSYRNIKVRLKDIDWGSLLNGVKSIQKIYKQLVKKRRLKENDAEIKMMQTVSTSKDYSGFHKVDLVIEAIVENMSIKKAVFKDLEQNVSKDCILATNTSSLSINEMAKELKHPERFIGIHFFSPANRMPLVEIIPSKTCKKEVISKAISLVKRMKKTPVVVKECPGFLVNRVLIPYVVEAIRCIEEGEKITRVDKLMTTFGMPIGPLALCDEVGLDIGFSVAKVLEDGYGERMALPKILQKFEGLDNCLGKKTKRGFYNYSGKKKKENMEIYSLCDSSKTKNKKEIEDRLILIMVNEALRCLEENIVNSAEELDLALIYGMGFPPFLGGILMYAQRRGFKKILQDLSTLSRQHGIRFKPCEKLKDLAENNKKLFN